MDPIITEKVEQAVGVLDEMGVDAWLTFVRETGESGDPVVPLILGQNLTWQSALIVTRTGERIAIVGKYDDGAVRATGAWSTVIPYVEGIREPLLEVLGRIRPRQIAVNFSRNDVTADGLTHGMFLLLTDYLAGTDFLAALGSADEIIATLRGRKTRSEIDRIRQAIAATVTLLRRIGGYAKIGRTEKQVADELRRMAADEGYGLAWPEQHCPIVNTGPDSMIGHGLPADLSIAAGHLFHIDFGIVHQDYCSDLQRMWYVPRPGEKAAPDPIQRAFDAVVRAVRAAANAVRPGVEGWQVDAAARRVLVDAGYPSYQHATGHQVGRSAHDGGGVLAPCWERYGQSPYRKLEPGNVFTVELGIDNVDGRGYLGLEEMLLVIDGGYEWLSSPQTELMLLR